MVSRAHELKARAHQKEAIKSLRSGSILCGGVGSGKSFTSLLYFWTKELDGIYDDINFKYPTKIKNLYIITTARKRDLGEWETECATFGIGTYPDSKIPVVIDSWNNIKKYQDVEDSFFIFDEQRVVGSGEWSKTFIYIAKHNDWIMLSATPGDTWIDYIPVFIANGYYKNRTSFIREHVVYDYFHRGKYPKIKMYINERKLEMFRNQILVDMENTKTAVRHRKWIKAKYDVNLYFRVWKQRWNVFEDKPIENTPELFMCMRRVANSDKSRIDILKTIFNMHKKAIVFYNFNYELKMLKDFCEQNDIPYSEYNGHVHQEIPTTDMWLYLVQYDAGKEGWNCIETNVSIFYSLNYSYKTFEQASGRIDRLNTPFNDLYYYHLYSPAPIDQGIRKALVNKKNFNERNYLSTYEKHVA